VRAQSLRQHLAQPEIALLVAVGEQRRAALLEHALERAPERVEREVPRVGLERVQRDRAAPRSVRDARALQLEQSFRVARERD
jgi:hypothetical protein